MKIAIALLCLNLIACAGGDSSEVRAGNYETLGVWNHKAASCATDFPFRLSMDVNSADISRVQKNSSGNDCSSKYKADFDLSGDVAVFTAVSMIETNCDNPNIPNVEYFDINRTAHHSMTISRGGCSISFERETN